jgi:3alpha(or 20beta)-hydroxysteroid dehydrogenase
MGRLEGKVAIITGAARGTGAETVRHFVAEGARVVLGDVLHDRGRQVAGELGEAARYHPLDVTSEAEWEEAVAFAEAEFGQVNVLVNNAAVLHMGTISDTTPEVFTRVFLVNQLGPFLGIRAVIEPLKRAGGGSIVNVSSVDGVRVHNGLAAYSSTKWGLRAITRVAAIELGQSGIRVNTVCPSAGSNEMFAEFIGKELHPKVIRADADPALIPTDRDRREEQLIDVAKLIAFLASDDSASCTGADYTIDRGETAGRFTPGMPGA